MGQARPIRARGAAAIATGIIFTCGIGIATAAQLTYEMALAPDAEAVPMTRLGDGFGDQTAGDFPPAGLLNGIGRFVDSGSNGKDAFLITNLGSTFTVDMRVMSNSFVLPPNGNDRRSMGVHDGSNGRGILVEPDGLRFVNGSGVVVGAALLDLTSLRQVRLVLTGGQVYVYDLDNDLDGGPGFNWPLLAGPIGLGGSGFGGEIAGLAGGLHINSLDVIGGSSVQKSDIAMDWLRIDTGVDRGATEDIIPPGVLPSCLSEVLPSAPQSVTAFQNEPAVPDHITYTVGNPGESNVEWTVGEVDAVGSPTDYAWFGLSNNGGSVAVEESGTVDVNAFDSSVEGAFAGYILFTDNCGPHGCLDEGFAYASGPLNGNDGWAGTAASEIAVDGDANAQTVKISGGEGNVDAVRSVSCGNGLGTISVKVKIRAGSGDSTMWYLHINDAAGTNLAQIYGSGTSVGGRIANGAGEDRVTQQKPLSGPAVWDEVEVRIFPASNKAAFYLNGALMARPAGGDPTLDLDGILDHGHTGAGDAVGQLRFERLNRADLPNDFLHFDDVTLSYGLDYMRRIDMQVTGCSLQIEEPQRRTIGPCGQTSVSQEVFTIRNNGAYDWTGFMANEFSDDDDWLTLSYESHAVARGETATITAIIDWSAVPSSDPADDQIGVIRFSVTCNGGASFIHETPPDTIVVVEDFVEVIRYDGSVSPDAVDSGGSGYSFVLLDDGSFDQGSVVIDPDAEDGLAYRIVDVAGIKTKWRTNPAFPITIQADSGATIFARIKTVAAEGTTGSNLLIYDDEISADLYWGGSNGIVREVDRAVQTSITGDDQYHLVRLTIQDEGGTNGIITRVYSDENPVPVFVLPDGGPIGSAAGLDALGFGTGSTPGTQEIYFDCVSGTNAGAFAPGEEVNCLGRKLGCETTCNLPRTDSDGDGDVDMTDFAELQRCISGEAVGGRLSATCDCFDRNNDDRITASDVTSFTFCESGPDVIWTSSESCPN